LIMTAERVCGELAPHEMVAPHQLATYQMALQILHEEKSRERNDARPDCTDCT